TGSCSPARVPAGVSGATLVAADPPALFSGLDARSVVNPGLSLTCPPRLRQYPRLEHLSADEYLSLLKCGRIRSEGLRPGFDNFGSERRGVFLAVVQQ